MAILQVQGQSSGEILSSPGPGTGLTYRVNVVVKVIGCWGDIVVNYRNGYLISFSHSNFISDKILKLS